MTTKYVFDGRGNASRRVGEFPDAWEELSPGIRVRRRVVGPQPSCGRRGHASPYRSTNHDTSGER